MGLRVPRESGRDRNGEDGCEIEPSALSWKRHTRKAPENHPSPRDYSPSPCTQWGLSIRRAGYRSLEEPGEAASSLAGQGEVLASTGGISKEKESISIVLQPVQFLK